MPEYLLNGWTHSITDDEIEEFLKNNPSATLKNQIEGNQLPTSQSALVEPGTALNTGFTSEGGSWGLQEDDAWESQEEDTWVERTFGKWFLTDFFGDLWRAAEMGIGRGQTLGENFEIFNRGIEATDEDILEMIRLNKESGNKQSDEMRNFQKVSEAAGGGVWGWIKGVLANPSVLPIVMAESIALMGSSLFDAKEAAAAGVAGAGTGAALGTSTGIFAPITSTAGAIAGFMGGIMGAMETGLTFGELLQDEILKEGKEFNLENVKELLADEEKYNRLKRRAVGRGVTIAAVETFTGGIAGKVGSKFVRGGSMVKGKGGIMEFQPLMRAGKEIGPRPFTGGLAAVGIESFGGGTGEVLGRVAADQEMDVNEILFEATAGISTAPINLTAALRSQAAYDMNGGVASRSDLENQLEADDIAFSKVKFKVKNDDALSKKINERLDELRIKRKLLKTRVTDTDDINKLVKIEKRIADLKDNETTAAKSELKDLNAEAKEITDKYSREGPKTKAFLELEGRNKEILDNLIEQKIKPSVDFAKSLDGSDVVNVKTISLSTTEEFNKAVKAAKLKDKKGRSINITGDEVGFYQDGTIWINEEAALDAELWNIGAHEGLHAILEQYFGDNTGDIVNKFRKVISTKYDKIVTRTIEKEYGYKDGTVEFYKEYLSQFADAVKNPKSAVKYNDDIFNSIRHFIQDYILKPLGFGNIGFETNRQVYNFMREYSASAKKGELSTSIQAVLRATKKVEKSKQTKGEVLESKKFTRINQKEFSKWYAGMKKEVDTRLEKENKNNPYWNNPEKYKKPLTSKGKVKYYNDLSIENMFKQHDHTYHYSDDSRVFNKGLGQEKIINNKIKELGGWTQDLVNTWNKYAPKNMEMVFEDLTTEEKSGEVLASKVLNKEETQKLNAKTDALVGPKDTDGNYTMTKREWNTTGVLTAYNAIVRGIDVDGNKIRNKITGKPMGLLDNLIRSKAIGLNIYGWSIENFIESVKTGKDVNPAKAKSLEDTLMRFNPEINNSLAGWINNELRHRITDVTEEYRRNPKVSEEVQTAIEQTMTDTPAPTEAPKTPKIKGKGKKIRPLTRLTTDTEIHTQFKTEVKAYIKENEMSDFNYRTLVIKAKSVLDRLVKKIFSKPGFIINNGKLLHSLLPFGAMSQSNLSIYGTSTGVKQSILSRFYKKEESTEDSTGRPSIDEGGTEAGLPTQNKLPFDEKQWNEEFTIPPEPSVKWETGKPKERGNETAEWKKWNSNKRNTKTLISALQYEIGRAMLNSEIRTELGNQGGKENVIITLSDGKSDVLASKEIGTVTGWGAHGLNEHSYENGKWAKGNITFKKKMRSITKEFSKYLAPEEKELIVYAITGTGKDKTDPTIGGRYALYPSTSAARKALGFKRSDVDKQKLEELRTTRRYGGILNITAKSKFDKYKDLFRKIKRNDNKTIRQILLENHTKKEKFLEFSSKLINLVLDNRDLRGFIYNLINVQDNYTGHFLRVLHPLVSMVDPKGLKKGEYLHDEHFSRSKRTAHYLIGTMENFSIRVEDGGKRPSVEEINDRLNELWSGMYRGVIGRTEAKNFSSTRDNGPQDKIDDSPLIEMKDNLDEANHLLIPNTILNPTDNVITLSEVSETGEVLASKKINKKREFNKILEETKGIDKNTVYSKLEANLLGRKNDKRRFWIPFSAEDFEGLLRQFVGRGVIGDRHLKFFDDYLLKPLAEAQMAWDAAKLKADNKLLAVRKILKKSGIDLGAQVKSTKEPSLEKYTNEQVIRMFIWYTTGREDLVGGDLKEQAAVRRYVRQELGLADIVQEIKNIYPDKMYPDPRDDWYAGTLLTDLLDEFNDTKRKEFFEPFWENAREIFGTWGKGKKLQGDNINKIKAIYGEGFVDALENMLYRIETGRNQGYNIDQTTKGFMNWTNDAVGTIMFFNTRSALLQMISFANFINWSDNNAMAASARFADQKQFWTDFAMIFNSDFLKSRRKGLRTDVNAQELTNAAAKSRNKIRGGISAILKLGFWPTQIADSAAIALGGASFYRNRVNSLMKKGMSKKNAEKQAFLDLQKIATASQQSALPWRISKQQAGPLGRIILAFQNTPMQYARLIKKAVVDLANGRGDWKTNMSKIVYYSAIQNVIFHGLQSAMFAMAFSDEDDDERKKRYQSLGNRMADTLLIGTGVYGAVAATTKNVILEVIDQAKSGRKDFEKAAIKSTAISPPISSKLQKLLRASRRFQYKQEIEKMHELGLSSRNPAVISAGEVLSAVFNLPADRAIRKWNNLVRAADNETELWQSIALAMGYSEWDVKIRDNVDKDKGGIKINRSGATINRPNIKINIE